MNKNVKTALWVFLALVVISVIMYVALIGSHVLYYKVKYSRSVPQETLSESFKLKNKKIDCVYLWCDGSDPAFQARKAKYQPASKASASSGNMRFSDNGELEYSVRKTKEYMGDLLGHIYIITPRQTPTWYNEKEHGSYITIVDVFEPLNGIDTFNSNVIECMMLNIEKQYTLTPHVLYFNDDFSINQPVTLETFFYADDKPRYVSDGWAFNPQFANMVTFGGEQVGSSILYTEKYYNERYPEHKGKHHMLRAHAPMIVNVRMYQDLLKEHDEEVSKSYTHVFRTFQDFVPLTFYLWYVVDNGYAKIGNDYKAQYVFINNSEVINRETMKHAIGNKDYTFICFNDSRTDNFEKTSKDMRKMLLSAN